MFNGVHINIVLIFIENILMYISFRARTNAFECGFVYLGTFSYFIYTVFILFYQFIVK